MLLGLSPFVSPAEVNHLGISPSLFCMSAHHLIDNFNFLRVQSTFSLDCQSIDENSIYEMKEKLSCRENGKVNSGE